LERLFEGMIEIERARPADCHGYRLLHQFFT
jgi:hypothetical protein